MRRAPAILVTLLAACESSASVLDPAGPRAEGGALLHWVMFAMGAAVFAVVLALLAYAIVRARRQRDLDEPAAVAGRADGLLLVVAGGVVLPLVVLPILWVLTIADMQRQAEPDEPAAVVVEVVGFQFAYEATCPGVDGPMTNEIRIPAGEPVLMRLTSEDVIHSFWVPQLAGKQDMIPGRTTELWIQADEPGVYIGECAEFCGLYHANMRFRLVAEDPDGCATAAASCCG